MEIEQEQRHETSNHAESIHRVLNTTVAIVTHIDSEGRTMTKVWVEDFHSMGNSKLIANIDMEAGG